MHKVIDIDPWKLVFLAIEQLWTKFLNHTEHDSSNNWDAEGNAIFSQSSDLNIDFIECFGVLGLQMYSDQLLRWDGWPDTN